MRLAIELLEDHGDASVGDMIDALIWIAERDRLACVSTPGLEPLIQRIDDTLILLEAASLSFYASMK